MNSHGITLPRSWGAISRLSRPGMLFLRALLALVFLMTLAPQSAFSQEADSAALPTWSKYPVDSPPYFTNMTDRSLAFQPAYGIPCIAYGGDALYYSCYNSTLNTWPTLILDYSANVGEYAAMAFDNYSRPFITYYDARNARLKLVYWSGAAWTYVVVPNVDGFSADPLPQTQATEPADLSVTPQEVPDSNLLPEADAQSLPQGEMIAPPTESYTSVPNSDEPVEDTSVDTLEETDEPGALERIQSFFQSWLEPLSPDFPFQGAGYGKYSSITIDRNNGIYISYYDEIDGSLEFQYWNGITWNGKVVDDYADQGDAGLWSSIAVDYTFNVNISYMSEKYDDLKYARRRSSGGWEIQTVDSEANVGSFSSIAVEQVPGNNAYYEPHVSYYDFSGDRLKHAYRDKDKNWHIQALDGSGITGWYTSIAIDPANRIHISYYNASKGDLKYARYDGSWTIRTLDSTGSNNVGLFTSIAIDRFGRPGIAYVHATYGALKFIYSPRQTNWNHALYVSYYSRDVGLSTSLAISDTGVPFVSYLDASFGQLKLARTYGANWSTKTLVSRPYSGLYSSIDLLNGSIPRIAYYEQENRDLMYAQDLGFLGWWHFGEIDTTYDVGRYVSMELDHTGLPHISYYDARTQDLLYASWSVVETDWYTDTVDARTESAVGLYSSMAVDTNNRPYISYYNAGQGSLMIAYKSPTLTWVKEVVDYIGRLPDTGVGAFSSIDIDNLGRPHISYYDLTGKVLKYAYWDGVWGGAGTWNISVVDPYWDVGLYTDLVINQADNTSHICYYSLTNGNLKYAQWPSGAGAWQRQVVDGSLADGDGVDEGDVGLYCSIDVNAAGQPVISYYDNSHADLKVAMSYAPPPALLFLPLTLTP